MIWTINKHYQRPRGVNKIGINNTIIESYNFNSKKRALEYMKELMKIKGIAKGRDANHNPILRQALGNNEYYFYKLVKS